MMLNCEPTRKPIPGMWLLAPPVALLLFLAGLLLVAIFLLPGLFYPPLNLVGRFRKSALLDYARLKPMIVTGTLFTKIRCVLTSHAFRTSPRLAALVYHHLGKLILALLALLTIVTIALAC